jgi:hypothetical protein
MTTPYAGKILKNNRLRPSAATAPALKIKFEIAATTRNWWDWKLWLQWTFANVAGEVLGLGLAAAVATAMVLTIGEPETAIIALMMAGVMIAAGALEGVIVGFAQWLVLRRRLCRLSRRE